jgi:hypothetical protein
MELPVGLRHVFAESRLYADEREYVVVSISLDALYEGTAMLAKMGEPFSVAVIDKDELTLVFPRDVWTVAREALPWADESPGYRLITFDVSLELGLVGYIATLVHVVAEAGVSLLVFSAYQRDHFLVLEEDFDQAWAALTAFIHSCQDES